MRCLVQLTNNMERRINQDMKTQNINLRVKQALHKLKELQKEKKAILFIDEIHTVIGAGATSGGSMDASNLLKPSLSKGNLRCIGSTTYKEFKNYFEKDRALVRRFQKIDIKKKEPEEKIKSPESKLPESKSQDTGKKSKSKK